MSYKVILITFLLFICSQLLAATDKQLKSQILRKANATHKLLLKSKTIKKKIKHIESLKKYVKNKTAKKAGPNYHWIEGFKMSLYGLNSSDLKKKSCSKLERRIYLDFAPQGNSSKDLPHFAQQTHSILKAFCK